MFGLGSLEQSPHLTEVFENSLGQGESRLREDLADAMLESPGSGPRSSGKLIFILIILFLLI